MTTAAKEVLDKYQIRKTKEQKAEFRSYLLRIAKENDCSARIEQNGNAQNIVIGDPDNAKVIYTAHYDTPAGTPFPNLMIPKNKLIYILYQVAICLMLYSVPILVMTLGSSLALKWTNSTVWQTIVLFFGYAIMIGILALLLVGPANKHNANDNTSGVSVLIDLMQMLPQDKKDSVALIFFDLEERGCVGSKAYSKAHKSKLKSTPVINFDCVGVGSTILLAPRKGAHYLAPKLDHAFEETEGIKREVVLSSTFSNSDHRNFPADGYSIQPTL